MRNVLSANKAGSVVLRTLGVFIVVLVLAAVAVFYGPGAYDHYLASQYQPSDQMATVTNRIKLSDEGKTLLYASKPAIESDEQFNKDCQSTERTTAMLGCYYKRRIYLYDIRNKELDGAVEVTAAHEMLHAAYDRLNMFERANVDTLIRKEYELVKNHPDIKGLMEYYHQAEPGSDINELHSIIGTTISDVSPALESYYQRYFTDRRLIVDMNTRYSSVFKEVQAKSNELAQQLKSESERLNQAVTTYETDRSQLDIDVQSFNERAQSGGFGSRSAFEAARSGLLARVNALNGRREEINAGVEAYNAKVKELQALSVRVSELNKSINGITSPESGL